MVDRDVIVTLFEHKETGERVMLACGNYNLTQYDVDADHGFQRADVLGMTADGAYVYLPRL